MIKHKITTIVLIFIFLSALFLRVNQLGKIPINLTDDELRETYSAYSLWKTGQGLTDRTMFPFMFIVDNFSFNPVPIYFSAPFVGIFGVSNQMARFPYAIAGFLSLLGTYLLIKTLVRKENIIIFSAFCMAFNVWAIQLSRMAYEAGFALLFYVWGTYVFVLDWKKHGVRYVFFSMALFFLAFNSYDAMKLLYIPIIMLLIIYKWKELWKNKKLLGIIFLSVCVTSLIFYYFYALKNPNVRGSQFSIFQNNAAAATSVEMSRRASTAPEFLKILYHNKLTYYSDIFIHHYLYAFSFDFLFLNQEASGIYSLWRRGNFYLVELPFLCIGAIYLFIKHRPVLFLSACMMFIAALPSGIGPEPFTYMTRSSFLLPWLVLWIGAGVVFLVESIKKKIWRWVLIVIIIIQYGFFIGGYLRQYYFEWPQNNSRYFAKGIQDVLEYLKPIQDQYKSILITNMGKTFALRLALDKHLNINFVQDVYRDNNKIVVFENIQLLPSCMETEGADPRLFMAPNTMYIASPDCHTQLPEAVINEPNSEMKWNVYMQRTKQ